MKKFISLLFTFIFMVVSVFSFESVDAEELTIKYNNTYYDYYMTGGNGKLSMSIINNSDSIINQAVNHYYSENSGAKVVNVIPFKFTVEDGMTWDEADDIATMYINIPTAFNLDKSTKIDLVRIIIDDTDASAPVVKTRSYRLADNERLYQLKNYSEVESIINSSSVVSSGNNFVDNYFSNQFAVLETGDFEETGTTYYMLITCKGDDTTTTSTTTKTTTTTKSTTTTKTTTTTKSTTTTTTKSTTTTSKNPTTTTTTKPGETTTTTTIENPQTGELGNQLYILIGVIGLIGIASLGAKFVKTSK